MYLIKYFLSNKFQYLFLKWLKSYLHKLILKIFISLSRNFILFNKHPGNFHNKTCFSKIVIFKMNIIEIFKN